MSIMISPRSQENQYHFQQQNPPPPTIPSTINSQVQPPSNYPIYSQFPQQQQQQQHGANNGSTAAYNLTYNNNYTTTNPIPPSNNSSFSLPSVPQAVFYEQVPSSTSNAGGPNQPPHGEANPSVYYYQQQFITQPVPNQGGFHDQFNTYPQFGFHDQQATGASNGPQGQPLTHVIPPPPIANAPGSAQTLPNPATAAGQQVGASEEIPFPGVLDTQSYNRHNSASSGSYHPRSNTYPVENKPVKHQRQSLTSSSLLGMTPETARRNRCSICQKQFKRPSSLQTHLYSHTGEKP